MLVTGRDGFKLDPRGTDQLSRLARVVTGEASLPEQLDLDSGLFQHLSPGGIIGQLVWLDVPTWWQPATELGMLVQQNAAPVDDENGYGKVTG